MVQVQVQILGYEKSNVVKQLKQTTLRATQRPQALHDGNPITKPETLIKVQFLRKHYGNGQQEQP